MQQPVLINKLTSSKLRTVIYAYNHLKPLEFCIRTGIYLDFADDAKTFGKAYTICAMLNDLKKFKVSIAESEYFDYLISYKNFKVEYANEKQNSPSIYTLVDYLKTRGFTEYRFIDYLYVNLEQFRCFIGEGLVDKDCIDRTYDQLSTIIDTPDIDISAITREITDINNLIKSLVKNHKQHLVSIDNLYSTAIDSVYQTSITAQTAVSATEEAFNLSMKKANALVKDKLSTITGNLQTVSDVYDTTINSSILNYINSFELQLDNILEKLKSDTNTDSTNSSDTNTQLNDTYIKLSNKIQEINESFTDLQQNNNTSNVLNELEGFSESLNKIVEELETTKTTNEQLSENMLEDLKISLKDLNNMLGAFNSLTDNYSAVHSVLNQVSGIYDNIDNLYANKMFDMKDNKQLYNYYDE